MTLLIKLGTSQLFLKLKNGDLIGLEHRLIFVVHYKRVDQVVAARCGRGHTTGGFDRCLMSNVNIIVCEA